MKVRAAVINTLALLVLPVAVANALTLYEDPATGQVFTTPGEGRLKIDSFPGTEPAAASETEPTAAPVTEPAASTGKELVEVSPITDDSFENVITIIDPKSPQFPLGQETRINMRFEPKDASDMWFQAGVRIQGTLENVQTDFADPAVPDTNLNDAYLRRARLEVGAGFGKHTSFYMDLRSDRVNQDLTRGEGDFNIGDAYVKISKPFDTSLVNFKLYRAKIDVARTETVKSAYVVAYDRPLVADFAAQYISLNRRAANVQMYGDWKKKIHYQVAAGDSIDAKAIRDLVGGSDFDITDQSLFYGGKVVLSPFNGWEEIKKTETYMGQGKHFSVGAAYWAVPQIKGETDGGAAFDLNHELINVEASAHYKGFFVQSEFFKFKDIVEDWNDAVLNVGESDGWYITSEYVMTNFHFIAPFARYETWDRFKGAEGTEQEAVLIGANWYLRGNTTKVGLVYEKVKYDENLISAGGARDEQKIRITSQFFF